MDHSLMRKAILQYKIMSYFMAITSTKIKSSEMLQKTELYLYTRCVVVHNKAMECQEHLK